MTENTDTTPAAAQQGGPGAPRKGGGLSSKLLPELKQIAGGLGIKANGLKKAELVAAIRQAQQQKPQDQGVKQRQPQGEQPDQSEQGRGQKQDQQPGQQGRDQQQGQQRDQQQGQQRDQQREQPDQSQQARGQKQDQKQDQQRDQKQQNRRQGQTDQPAQKGRPQEQQQDPQAGGEGDDEGGSRRNRRRRGRDRAGAQTGGVRGNRNEPDLTVLDDDVLAPCAGILDVLDNYAFVRTSGYLPGTDDVYVSMSMVRKFGLRRGDAITGQVRQPREGERREKFNPLVQIDSVNGGEPEAGKGRVEFADLTAVHPTERLRLETTGSNVVGRVIDLVAPVGKGQRGLVVAPAKAGSTMLLKSMAGSLTANHPEVHLMVVLLDERPEEVTDFERTVRGEVISSTFDRPATDHTTVAELAIERAKRLVELGHDVVILLDGITRLGRAYNLAAPPGGRILPGGVDATALHPSKKFFGAARNIEGGGSLTILATAVVESGSALDEAIFEEFRGTDNLEIRLRRDLADRRMFPAVDTTRSGTRREELLMGAEELDIVRKLRRALAGVDPQEALELLLRRVRGSQNNIDLLTQVQKNTPALPGVDG